MALHLERKKKLHLAANLQQPFNFPSISTEIGRNATRGCSRVAHKKASTRLDEAKWLK